MLSLLDDAADDIAAVETEKHERALHQEAVALVQRFLPNFNSSPEPFGSFLVFTPGQVIELLEAIDEFGLDDSQDEGTVDEEHLWRLPSAEQLDDIARDNLGVTYEQEPDTLAALAAIQLTVDVWRNTYLEELHAGSHPSGGFPDADMMRFNIATSRLASEHVSADAINWSGMRQAVPAPARVLPCGMTLAELAVHSWWAGKPRLSNPRPPGPQYTALAEQKALICRYFLGWSVRLKAHGLGRIRHDSARFSHSRGSSG